jgi:hypothetical protein
MTTWNPNALLPTLTGAGTVLARNFEIFAGAPTGDALSLMAAPTGTRFSIGQRDGQAITAELSERGRGIPEDVYFDVSDADQATEIRLNVEENGTAGLLHFFMTPEETFLFNIDTRYFENDSRRDRRRPAMKNGAGTVLLTWLATQAALRGVAFAVTGIENFKVADIIFKQGLIAAGTGRVEFCHSYKEGRYACVRKFSLDNETALYGYETHHLDYPKRFLIISGRPSPRLKTFRSQAGLS